MKKSVLIFLVLGLLFCQAQATESISVSVDNHTYSCVEEKFKYYCDCKIKEGCGGICWVPVYLKLDLATGLENVIKYLDTQPGSESSCYTKIQKHPLCR